MTGVDQLVGALSGGNQQKVVLAKWLASKPTVLILDEPTRGIDIGAKVEVHRIISELAASGLGIILISSDLPEVLAMSDRILVLHEGRITAEIPRDRATQERVMFAATGNVGGRRRRRGSRRHRRRRPVAESGVTAVGASRRPAGSWLSTIARQRELSLLAIMFVLGGLVSLAAPQFLTVANLSQVAILASIIAVAAVGQALVIITRNVDLSVEAIIGLVAYCVARTSSSSTRSTRPARSCSGSGSGSSSGWSTASIVTVLQGAGDRGHARDAEHLPRHRLPGRRQPPGPAGRPPARLHRGLGRDRSSGIPIFVLDRRRRRGHRDACSSAGRGSGGRSTRSGATRRRRPSSASRRGCVVFVAFSVCGLLAGVAGVMWVMRVRDDQRDVRDRRRARGRGRGRRRRRGHLRRVGDARRRRASARCSSGSSPTPSSSSACRSSGSRPSTARSSCSPSAPTRSSCDATPAGDGGAARPDDRVVGSADGERPVDAPARALGDPARSSRWSGSIVLGNALSPFFLTPGNFSNLIAALMEVAIMALPMTLIIIAGEIDLSVESMAGLASAILGFLWAAGVPLEIGIPVVLVVGALGGLLNGLLVARGGLPSLVVTLGTLALFRGLALIVLGPRGVSDFPPGVHGARASAHVPGTLIPWPFVIFVALAAHARRRAPSDVDRSAGLRHRQERRRGALLGRARHAGQGRPVRPVRADRGAGRDHPDVAPVERPRRCRRRA